ncbi:MAG: flagellin [Candidatus Gastranaerophilales bacterium]|nr:flagellin [Candidatus Gastranaerophilales bacterium]
MAIVINTNTLSLTAQNSLNKAQSAMGKALERMSTGYKINTAADDAAGLSIATNLNTQIKGSQVAQSNIQQGSNVLSTTEGALNSITDNINRVRELANQAANGVNSSDSSKAIVKEMVARLAEIDKTAASTQFNGVKLLDGTMTDMRLQVGANADATENSITVENVFKDSSSGDTGLKIALSGEMKKAADGGTFVLATFATESAAYLDTLDTALNTVTAQKADIGAYQNRLTSNLDNLTTTITNMQSSKSTIMDADVATESANFTQQSILQQASASLLAQANQVPSIALSLI